MVLLLSIHIYKIYLLVKKACSSLKGRLLSTAQHIFNSRLYLVLLLALQTRVRELRASPQCREEGLRCIENVGKKDFDREEERSKRKVDERSGWHCLTRDHTATRHVTLTSVGCFLK